ncbi:MAG: DUF86 domain-containing protein [Xanthomonadaceae bacterium]|nr:DUF86 domain-containing protein [Xanthomonadaceae bacterium]MDP2186435.1 DUF86 domain-containing protein [Xanthomonadales bacterium]MDZ4379249.1 DUF86 domain-containing protein [Xanthomonadaceae bacterium]
MDRAVVAQKLESLRRCIARIEAKCPASAQALVDDADLQDIIALNLTRAVQLGVDIAAHLIAERMDVPAPGTMGQTFDALAQTGIIDAALSERLKKAVGFRNIAVHSYERIDWLIVHAIARHHLADFTAFAQCVARAPTGRSSG